MKRDMKNITRLDGNYASGNKGFWVRFTRQGERFSKLFSDGKYESSSAAYNAALAWRDEMQNKLPDPDPARKGMSTREDRDKAIKTGVPGLSLRFVDRKKTGNKVPVLFVTGQVLREGKPHRIQQSTCMENRGLRKALWNACAKLGKLRKDFYGWDSKTTQQKVQEYYSTALAPLSRVLPGYVGEDYNKNPTNPGGKEAINQFRTSEPIRISEYV